MYNTIHTYSMYSVPALVWQVWVDDDHTPPIFISNAEICVLCDLHSSTGKFGRVASSPVCSLFQGNIQPNARRGPSQLWTEMVHTLQTTLELGTYWKFYFSTAVLVCTKQEGLFSMWSAHGKARSRSSSVALTNDIWKTDKQKSKQKSKVSQL